MTDTDKVGKPTIIGFSGAKESGKSTAANILKDEGFVEVKFAGALKAMLRAYLRYVGADSVLIERMIEGDLKETPTDLLGGKTPRLAMQTLGTEWGRDLIYDDIWVDSFMRRAKQFTHVVCTDVRFPNEVEAVTNAGGDVYRIDRPSQEKNDFSSHQSEMFIMELGETTVITNDGTIDDLKGAVAEELGLSPTEPNKTRNIRIKFTMEWSEDIMLSNDASQLDVLLSELEMVSDLAIDFNINASDACSVHGEFA